MTEFARILADLNEAEVAYVVIGGLAVISHGVVRATRDVDAIVAQDEANLERVSSLVDGWGATRPDGSPLPAGWIRPGRVISLSTPHGGVDLLPDRGPDLDFESLERRSSVRRFDGEPANVVSLADLVALKRIAGRPAGELDLTRLREAHGELPQLRRR